MQTNPGGETDKGGGAGQRVEWVEGVEQLEEDVCPARALGRRSTF